MKLRFRPLASLRRTLLPLVWVACVAESYAADHVAQWGPPLGSEIPLLQASDQDGKPRELANLRGERGFLLFFNRSADW